MKDQNSRIVYFVCFLLVLVCNNNISAQILNGSLFLDTQLKINDFNYSEVNGSITIQESTPGDITDLSPLGHLTKVNGWLEITRNASLIDLNGLQNLTYTEYFILSNNASLINIEALQNLIFVEYDLYITGNASLNSLEGLHNLTRVGLDFFLGNHMLKDLNGLRNLTSVGENFEIGGNNSLINLEGLENLTRVGRDLIIRGNKALINIDGLSNVSSSPHRLGVIGNEALKNVDGLINIRNVRALLGIIDNASLSNINGLQNIISVGWYIDVINNPSLKRFCGLYSLLNSGNYQRIDISNNGIQISVQEILDEGECVFSIEEAVDDLIQVVIDLDLPKGTENSLTSTLENAQKSLEKGNAGAAINQLEAFINKVEAQRGKKINEEEADRLIADVERIIEAIENGLNKKGYVAENTSKDIIPTEYSLRQNYPNPFNPSTTISYAIPKDGYIELSIYDALGNEVAKLEDRYKSAGNYSYIFDASELSSGIYFYTIKANEFTTTKKMLLMK